MEPPLPIIPNDAPTKKASIYPIITMSFELSMLKTCLMDDAAELVFPSTNMQ